MPANFFAIARGVVWFAIPLPFAIVFAQLLYFSARFDPSIINKLLKLVHDFRWTLRIGIWGGPFAAAWAYFHWSTTIAWMVIWLWWFDLIMMGMYRKIALTQQKQ